MVFGKTVPDVSLNAVANLGYADLRFGVPVYAGDTLSAASKVIGLRENSSGKTGTVYVRSTGTNQHGGNRDYFGVENVERARKSPVRRSLSSIARIRRDSPALQRGLQVNLDFGRDTATFYRVFRRDGVAETALVLLNKAAEPADIGIAAWREDLAWRDAATGGTVNATAVSVPANGVVVLIADDVPKAADTVARLDQLQATARRE